MKSWTSEEVIRDHEALIRKWKLQDGMGRRRIADELTGLTERSCSESVIYNVFRKLGISGKHGEIDPPAPAKPLQMESPDSGEDEEYSIEELIEARVKASARKKNKFKRHTRNIVLPAEPVGFFVFGDPHVDNDGCDWETLSAHVHLAKTTEGILSACVGDIQDNWIGRLARLYANASIKASDGWRLSGWLLEELQWIAICGGNHDAWANGPGVDPLEWLTREHGVMCYAADEIRMTISWRDHPELERYVWRMRHDFSGRSWYHPTHGPHKEAMLDGRCHLMTAGHIHQWGVLTTEHRHARIADAVRVRGYKRNDEYALQKGFPEQQYGESCLVVVDPFRVGPGRTVVFWDLYRGAEYLTWLRAQHAERNR